MAKMCLKTIEKSLFKLDKSTIWNGVKDYCHSAKLIVF